VGTTRPRARRTHERAPQPLCNFKGRHGDRGRHSAAAPLPEPLCPPPPPRPLRGNRLSAQEEGFRAGISGAPSAGLPPDEGRGEHPSASMPPSPQSRRLHPGATYPARPEPRDAQTAHSPGAPSPSPAARGAGERALCPSPARTPLSHMQGTNEQQEGVAEPPAGRRPASPLHAQHSLTRSRHTCAGIRGRPVAVTSFTYAWGAWGRGGRERPWPRWGVGGTLTLSTGLREKGNEGMGGH
jgi:hypothetical protein